MKPRATLQKILRWAWPSESRDTLLRAALLPDHHDAQASLMQWLAKHDLDEITFADHRLLAAISERLGPHIKDLPEYPRLKGLQRQLWTQSRIRLNANLPMLKILVEAGINVMLLKGAARLATDSAAQRQRSQQDVDILVPVDQMRHAARLLSENGWQTVRGDSPLAAIARATTTRAINFQQKPFGDIDLHRCAYHGNQNQEACDAALWKDAQPADFLGIKVLVPCAAERLTMMLAHGARSPEAHSDWLIDAAELIKSGQVDWRQASEIIMKRKMALQAAIGLSYLQCIMGQDFIPSAKKALIELNIPLAASTFGNLLIGREESRTPRPLRPLRQLYFSLSRTQKQSENAADIAPLIVTLAKQSLGSSPITTLEQSAISHLIPRPETVDGAPQTQIFTAEIRFPHPGVRRRVELELNSEEQNLARFRILVWRGKQGQCRAHLKTELNISETPNIVKLEARLGTTLSTDKKDLHSPKYVAVPFEIVSASWAHKQQP